MKPLNYRNALNILHYCIWLEQIRFCKILEKLITYNFIFFSFIFRLCFRIKYEEKNSYCTQETNNLFYNRKNGICIIMAHHLFGACCSCYSYFIVFIILGLFIKNQIIVNSISIIFIGLYALICYIPAYKTVISHNSYLLFFKEFEKKDLKWHHKWRLITVAFILGAITLFLFGITIMILIAES